VCAQEYLLMSNDLSWDAIVIGSGLGGLAAAAAIANRGKRVLVLERHASFGGAATVYRHGALSIEGSLHEIDGDTVYGAHGPIARLGLTGSVEPVATDIFYEARGAMLPTVRVPHGLDAAHEALAQAMPRSRRALKKFFKEANRLHRSFHDLEELGARGPVVMAGLILSGRLFELLMDSRRTLHQKLAAIFGDDEIPKFVLGAPLAYFDDDPRKLSCLLYLGVWARYVEAGSYYFKGGSRALAAALVMHIHDRAGAVQSSSKVESIVLDGTRSATGVTYTDAAGTLHEARAPIVFGNAAPAAIAKMLPPAARSIFARQYERFEPSISLFSVSLGLTRPAADFGVSAYSTFIYPDSMARFADFAKAAAVFGAAPAQRVPPYVLADYGRLATGLRNAGDLHALSITGVDRLAWWQGLDAAAERTRREQWIDALLVDVDRRYPGLRSAVAQREVATSRTMHNWLGTPVGEVYGFRPTPSRLFSRPPTATTPIRGLWLSSAFTVSGGYAGAMQGGLMAADAAMRQLRKGPRARAS
jgi:all-trans-retinol 13,14-reductase